MSIPLDRLYHYIESVANEMHGDVIIYRFWPHGSKKISDLNMSNANASWQRMNMCPEVFCHDQEPLDFERYSYETTQSDHLDHPKIMTILRKHQLDLPRYNLRGTIRNIWDYAILLHSEQRSPQIDQYQACQFIPVYYWCHGVVALDWFRYARHIVQHKNVKKLFLIYNRAWAGTREYRLKFADLLVENNLVNQCQTNISAVEPELGIHYNHHIFENKIWKPRLQLEDYFAGTRASSDSSADFDLHDYESTQIEVVLETLYDDPRWHLTEKILRPIACGQPFILASTFQSLKYLQQYGFQTYDSVWNESYDNIADPLERLQAIVKLMNEIDQWDEKTKKQKFSKAYEIANYNKDHFFSVEFSKLLLQELETNLSTAFMQLEKENTSTGWMHRISLMKSIPEWLEFANQTRTPDEFNKVFDCAEQFHKQNCK
jgi:hypothetical protein